MATYDAGEASASRRNCGASGASWSQSTTASPATGSSDASPGPPSSSASTTTSRPTLVAMVPIAAEIGLELSTRIRPCSGPSSDHGCSRCVVLTASAFQERQPDLAVGVVDVEVDQADA